MHIIIPMSGIGNRFIQAGYTVPKPLLVIDGKPIIEHVCDLFPGETKITFICSEHHLQTTAMRAILTAIRPTAKIVGIAPHKLGPVYAVAQIFDQIDDEEEVIVNYCDFGTGWDYQDFLRHTRSRQADGAVPAYRHFHPHMLGSTNYAFMQHEQQWMLAIQEKKPFTDNRMDEFASNGTYYFKKGRFVKKYFQQLMDEGPALNGEFYVSMVYNLLVKDGLKVSIYEIEYMLQWGTPEDVQEYLKWSDYFRTLMTLDPSERKNTGAHINLIPMAGLGQRFALAGYSLPKPLIPVLGKPMVVQAASALPKANQTIFVCLEQHKPVVSPVLQAYDSNSQVIGLSKVTEGQAITCAQGLKNIHDREQGLFIAACDNSMLYNKERWQALLLDPAVDVIVFTFKNHISVKQNPQMYGYVSVDDHDNVTGVSVKTPLSETPEKDHAIVGAFYFKKIRMFDEALAALQQKNIRVNGEYYVDSLIGELILLGYKVEPLLVDHYIGWGTPNDLKTFEYWQSFFHQTDWHSYHSKADIATEAHVQEFC